VLDARRGAIRRAVTLRPILVVVSFALTACGGTLQDTGGATPSPSPPALQSAVISSDLVTGGDQRVAIGVLNQDGVPVAEATVVVQIVTVPAPGGQASPVALGPPQPAPYKGALLQGKGVYVVHQTFTQPGFYRAMVQATKGPAVGRTQSAFQVRAPSDDPLPGVGRPAPSSQTPTGDPTKDPSLDTGVPPDDMHYISLAAAIAAHHAVAVFIGSPGFCETKTCGPVVDVVKSLEPKYRPRGVDFIHIETYKGGRPDANRSISSALDAWNLAGASAKQGTALDPWVFVIDKAGKIAGRFDGPITANEIEPVLAQVAAS
jgi:hypothetical protein